MDNNVIALEKILGSLRQVSFYKNSHKCSDFIDTSRFSATKYILSCWSHYGQYNENRLVLMHEGNTDDIELNGYTISSTVKDIHFFLTSRDVNEHDFTFSIQASDGEVYEQTFHIENNELLPHIVYAIILLTSVKDKNKTSIFWTMLIQGTIPYVSLGQKLDYVNELKMIAKSIIEEYPFTKQFFQDGLKEIVSKLKSELSSLEKLKKRFNLIPFCSF